MGKIKKIMMWIIGIILLLLFSGMISKNPVLAIIMAISGIMIIPPVNTQINKLITQKIADNDEEKAKGYKLIKNIIVVILILMSFGLVPGEKNQNEQSVSNTTINEALNALNTLNATNQIANEWTNEINQNAVDSAVAKTITETNGTYTGDRVDGKKQGNGKFEWTDGSIYEGEFSEDKINGNGKLTIKDKGTYEGNFVDGKRSGNGTYLFLNGDKYEGEWKDDKMEGQGTYTFSNGDTYTGSFSDNKFNGTGTYKKDNNTYTGTWENNEYKSKK
ncbi:MAG: MORN repeat-containing protein [Clostridia bacterium]